MDRLRVFRSFVAPLLLGFAAFLFALVYLRLPERWWFEDDPGLYADMRDVLHPLAIFIDRDVIRGFGMGKALVPLQMLSFWSDVHMFGANPAAAYWHTLLSFLAVVLLMYAFMLLCTANRLIATATPLIWMLLPSTLSILFFISTRHYLEGLLFGLAASWCALYACRRYDRIPYWLVGLISLFALCSVHSKEIFATTLPTFLFLLGFAYRRYVISLVSVVVLVVYVFYRFWALGSDLTYTERLLDLPDYLRYLTVLPYSLTLSPFGYIVYGGAFCLVAYLCWRRLINWRMLLVGCVLLASALTAIYAVAYPVLLTYNVPNTWNRVPYILHTVALLWTMVVLARLPSQTGKIVAIVLVVLVVLPSTVESHNWWDMRLQRAEQEGRYYLDHPDRLLYSEEPAWWFIMGVHELYEVEVPHYVTKHFVSDSYLEALLPLHKTIWRYRDGEFINDDLLFATLRAEYQMADASQE